MALDNGLVIADVAHARMRPKKNSFHYHVYYLCTALSDWQALSRLRLFSLERFNLFGVRAADYYGPSPSEWIRGVLARFGVTTADGEVVLLTLPRVLGYAFNPVSFWFCLDGKGQLRTVLADVRNTFGERHGYLLFHDDQRVIGRDDWLRSEKTFHVSPFIPVEGHYEFRFVYDEKTIGVWINHHDADGLLLTTSLVGRRRALTSGSLFYAFFRYPLVTIKVITLIHWQAFKLIFKGVRYRLKPSLPELEITR